MSITTHVLDLARGRPAEGIEVTLEMADRTGSFWHPIGTDHTNPDGRAQTLVPETANLQPGRYRLTFQTAPYFAAHDTDTFYPRIVIEFQVPDETQHYHVPLLLSPFGYSTYRGS